MIPDLTFLPGKFQITRGRGRDYGKLARFHYLPKRPATWAAVWRVHYRATGKKPRLVAVAVLSYPSPSSLPRRRALGIAGDRDDELRYANLHIRTISRVVVHPQFRALGLSTWLVRWMCAHCDTRYTEALAVMGRAIPFFERAGMKRYEPASSDGPVYYLYERGMPCRTGILPAPPSTMAQANHPAQDARGCLNFRSHFSKGGFPCL